LVLISFDRIAIFLAMSLASRILLRHLARQRHQAGKDSALLRKSGDRFFPIRTCAKSKIWFALQRLQLGSAH